MANNIRGRAFSTPVPFDNGIQLGTNSNSLLGALKRSGTVFQGYNGTDWVTFVGTTSDGSSGRIPYFSANGLLTHESNLVWDATNDRLGVGTSSPTKTLEVRAESIEWPILQHLFNNTASGRNCILQRRSLGTVASPAGVTSGTVIGGLSCGGRDSSGNNTSGFDGGGEALFLANGTWTSSDRRTRFELHLTQPSGTNVARALYMAQGAGEFAAWFANSGGAVTQHGLKVQAGTNADGGGGASTYYLWAVTGNDSANVGYLENTTGGTFQLVTVSDARTKTDIGPTEINGLDVISSLAPRKFKKRGQDNRIGFVAQEVEAVFPEAVSTDPEGMKGVAYSALVPVLVKALQELSDLVKSQAIEIDNLKKVVEIRASGQ